MNDVERSRHIANLAQAAESMSRALRALEDIVQRPNSGYYNDQVEATRKNYVEIQQQITENLVQTVSAA